MFRNHRRGIPIRIQSSAADSWSAKRGLASYRSLITPDKTRDYTPCYPVFQGALFQWLQWELIKKNIYATRREACYNVFDYIEMYYNLIRFHGSDDGLSPAEFESSSMFKNRVSRKLGAIQYGPR
ncbi:hypothetical protein FGM04_04575 [Aeromonas veronii]|nr:hypothetical protein FGM04_04575 [Aeromonas veronii]